jgi:hypothetical protein
MATKLHDRHVRYALDLRLREEFASDATAVIIHELGLSQGHVRIDIAVVNGTLNGYEIKSPADNLQRLPAQQLVYNQVLETVTLVADEQHLDHAVDSVPDWWGLSHIQGVHGEIVITSRRRPMPNPAVDPSAQVQLLWRDEALAILRTHRLERGLAGKPRRHLWQRLVEAFGPEQVSALVRETLKARGGWRQLSPSLNVEDPPELVRTRALVAAAEHAVPGLFDESGVDHRRLPFMADDPRC